MCTSAIYLITSLPVVGKLLFKLSDDAERNPSSLFNIKVYDLAVSGETLVVSRSGDLLFYQMN